MGDARMGSAQMGSALRRINTGSRWNLDRVTEQAVDLSPCLTTSNRGCIGDGAHLGDIHCAVGAAKELGSERLKLKPLVVTAILYSTKVSLRKSAMFRRLTCWISP